MTACGLTVEIGTLFIEQPSSESLAEPNMEFSG